jgi:hypothetical protein
VFCRSCKLKKKKLTLKTKKKIILFFDWNESDLRGFFSPLSHDNNNDNTVKNPNNEFIHLNFEMYIYDVFEGDTTITAVIQFFDTIFIVPYRHRNLKIGLSFGDYLFISAKFLSSKHSFEVSKQKKVTGGQIWRIRWMEQRFVAYFMQFCRRFD